MSSLHVSNPIPTWRRTTAIALGALLTVAAAAAGAPAAAATGVPDPDAGVPVTEVVTPPDGVEPTFTGSAQIASDLSDGEPTASPTTIPTQLILPLPGKYDYETLEPAGPGDTIEILDPGDGCGWGGLPYVWLSFGGGEATFLLERTTDYWCTYTIPADQVTPAYWTPQHAVQLVFSHSANWSDVLTGGFTVKLWLSGPSGAGWTGTADEPTPPGPDGKPTAPPAARTADDLVGTSPGSITLGAAPVVAGDTVTIDLGAEYAGAWTAPWLFSTPTLLATDWLQADAAGRLVVRVPSGTEAGQHRLAVFGADGALLGWQRVAVTKPLAATGGDLAVGWIVLGALVVGFGGVLVVAARRVSSSG